MACSVTPSRLESTCTTAWNDMNVVDVVIWAGKSCTRIESPRWQKSTRVYVPLAPGATDDDTVAVAMDVEVRGAAVVLFMTTRHLLRRT